MVTWKRIGIALKSGQTGVLPLLQRIGEIVREHDLELDVDPNAALAAPDLSAATPLPFEALIERCDLLVVLGGDGTMLAAARAMAEHDVPILGVNLGQVGFLADTAPENLEVALRTVLEGRHGIRERSRLHITRRDEKGETSLGHVLNDGVITKGSALARLIEVEARVGERLIARYRGDGLILSTPTGSTAYNLSAGGPLVDPDLPALIISPICPHTLTQRPLVLPDSLEIDVRLLSQEEALLTLDGQVGVSLQGGDRIHVSRSPHPVRFVTVPGVDDAFETLREKLGWGSR